jgi:hypothetical protein
MKLFLRPNPDQTQDKARRLEQELQQARFVHSQQTIHNTTEVLQVTVTAHDMLSSEKHL